jgi:hypothetical protein
VKRDPLPPVTGRRREEEEEIDYEAESIPLETGEASLPSAKNADFCTIRFFKRVRFVFAIIHIASTLAYMMNIEQPQIWTSRPIISIFE